MTASTALPRPRPARLACAAAAAALLLAGCTTLAPPYEAPAMPVPQRYAGAAEPGGAVAAATAWRDYFTDPQLQALIVQALEHNRDLRTAALRVQEARAAYGIQSAELSPSVGAQANMDRARTPADLSLTGRPMVASQYQVGLGMASWEIDFWGRVQSLRDAALDAVTVSLIAQVAGGYLALRELDERLALAEQSSASREESLRISRRRVEVGSDSRLHLTQMQTLLTQAQALVAQLSLERARQAHALGQLVGTGVALAPAAGRLAEQQMPRLAAGLPSDLLAQRPDIVAAEHQLRAAHAQIGAARAAFFPSISLTGAFGTASAELGGLFEGGSRAWTFSPSITLPIFSGGRLKGNLALAEVRRDLAVANYERAVQQAFRDVSDALAGRQWLERQSRIAQEALAVQTERARLSQLRYDHGAAAFLDVLDAQRDLLVAQQQTVQAQRLLLSSQVSLYAALGGGTLTQTNTPIGPRGPGTP